MNAFLHTVNQLTHLSEESEQALGEVLQRHEHLKGHTLVKQDTVCNHVYFIEKGLSRTYYLKDGKDITDWISAENDFAVSIVSFLTRKADRRIIELLEPSIVWSLSSNDLEKLYLQYHDIERLGRLLVNSAVIQMQQRFDDLHFSTAAERYQCLMEKNPSFIQRVPLGMIASYLGITQETLSRIRAKHSF